MSPECEIVVTGVALQMKKSACGVLSCPPTRTKLLIRKMWFSEKIIAIEVKSQHGCSAQKSARNAVIRSLEDDNA